MRLNDNEIEKLKHHFGLLGISPTNNKEAIESNYQKQFDLNHPDRGLNKDEHNDKHRKVHELYDSKEFCLRYAHIENLVQQISDFNIREYNKVLNRKNFWARIRFIVSNLRASIKEWIKVKEERATLRFVDLGFKNLTKLPYPSENPKPNILERAMDIFWIVPLIFLIVLNLIYLLPFCYIILNFLFFKIAFIHLFNLFRGKDKIYYEDKPISFTPIYLLPASIFSIVIILTVVYTYYSAINVYENIGKYNAIILPSVNMKAPSEPKTIRREENTVTVNNIENGKEKVSENNSTDNLIPSPPTEKNNKETTKYINAEDGTLVKEEPTANKETINILPHGTMITTQDSVANSDYTYCIECKGYIFKKVLSESKPVKNRKYKLLKEKEGMFYYQVAFTTSKEFYELSNNEAILYNKGKREVGSYSIDGHSIKIEINGINKNYKFLGKVESRNKFWEIVE